MGFLDKKVDSARARQKQALIQEANKAGAQVVGVWDVGDAEHTGTGTVGDTLTQLFGGRLKADGVQIMLLDTQGFRHVYVQPYTGMYPIPGEHHAILGGCLPAPAILRAGGMLSGAKWDTGQMAGLAKSLNSNPALTAATHRIAWDWDSGLTKVELGWAVQLRSIGDGSSHLVLKAGRYGGFTTYEVGFAKFLQVSGAIHGFLAQAQVPAQHFPELASFESAIDVIRAGGLPQPEEQPQQATNQSAAPTQPVVRRDYSEVVQAALAPHLSKKVHLGADIPPKKLANARKHALPADVANSPLLALIDLTTFGSAKDALAVTATHLYAKEIDEQIALPLHELQRVVNEPSLGNANAADVETTSFGLMSVPVGFSDEAVVALLRAIAQANQSLSGDLSVSAFVSEKPGQGISQEEAAAVQQEWQQNLSVGTDVNDKINAAARLMTAGQFAACVDAYQAIAAQHPEVTGTCHGQIGAAYYFLGDYHRAIQYYESAKQHGADPDMMNDNIAEARQALA